MKKAWLFGSVLLIVLLIVVSLTHGKLAISFSALLQVFLGEGTKAQQLLVIDFRLPRILIAILAGSALGVSGTILQSITQNPLADSGILGINAGAGLAVLLFISFVETSGNVPLLLPFVALVGALLSAGLIFAAAYKPRIGITPLRMVLTGVVLSIGITAISLLVTSQIDAEKYRFAALWQAGSIWGSNWTFVWALLPWLLALYPLVWRQHRVLDIMQLGDETSISVGIAVKKSRSRLLLLAATLAGAAVSVAGGIGFLGLIAPHIARRLGFKKHWELFPAAAILGALILLAADTVGRLLPGTGELPAGTVVAIIGAPYFLYLMVKETV